MNGSGREGRDDGRWEYVATTKRVGATMKKRGVETLIILTVVSLIVVVVAVEDVLTFLYH